MRWIEPEAKPRTVPPSVTARMLREAVARGVATDAQRSDLAKALFWSGDYAAAVAEYEALCRKHPDNAGHWASLSRVLLKDGRPSEALAAIERAEAAGEPRHRLRGKILGKLGRIDDAVAELRACYAHDRSLASLVELLAVLAKRDDPAALLACESAPPEFAGSTPVRAYRAIALSRAGRTSEAAALIDLERHVARERIAVPGGFASLDAFNEKLAQEILAMPAPVPSRDGVDVNYEPFVSDSPTFAAIHAVMREAIERYIASMPSRGLGAVMPPPPEAGHFFAANVVLTEDGCNGEHIHGPGYVSAVYHVAVPQAVTDANDERGALALGTCASHTGGYQPCWGVRYIKPEPGWLTIFPSHIFHDVVPSLTSQPRISVVADLRPVEQAP